jgi:hypothetical protein
VGAAEMERFLCNIQEIDKYQGYYIASPVYDDSGRLLLNFNFQINDRAISALRKNEIHLVWLCSERVEEALEQDRDSKDLASIKAKRSALQNTFCDIRKDVALNAKRNKMKISLSKKNIKKVENAIDSMLDQILKNPFVAATLEPLYCEGDFLIRHSVNTTYFGLCMMSNYPGIIEILRDPEKGLVRFQNSQVINPQSLDISTFGMACFLHDIGKIYILSVVGSDEKYKDDDEEVWNQIKKHPTIGHDMLFGKQMDAHVLLGIKYHHENMDGSGYPYGIEGYKIHPFSRMIRIIDSFDAAITKGPGRADKNFKEILGELLGLSGTLYDPDLVKYFIDMLLGGKSGLVSKGYLI